MWHNFEPNEVKVRIIFLHQENVYSARKLTLFKKFSKLTLDQLLCHTDTTGLKVTKSSFYSEVYRTYLACCIMTRSPNITEYICQTRTLLLRCRAMFITFSSNVKFAVYV